MHVFSLRLRSAVRGGLGPSQYGQNYVDKGMGNCRLHLNFIYNHHNLCLISTNLH